MKSQFSARMTIAYLLCTLAVSLPFVSAQQAVNPQPSSIQIAGLQNRVTIKRDERGIPYINAENDEDLYFGQGFATAADRLWQMDLLRRSARG